MFFGFCLSTKPNLDKTLTPPPSKRGKTNHGKEKNAAKRRNAANQKNPTIITPIAAMKNTIPKVMISAKITALKACQSINGPT